MVKKVLSVFFIAGFLFIPLNFLGTDYQYLLTRFIFLRPVTFIQDHFFTHALKNIDFSSDTIGLNILLCLLLYAALLFMLLLYTCKIKTDWVVPAGRSLSAYYMAAVLLEYGLDKLVKRQFYLPEPNILYSNVGALSKDILYWSAMGTSHSYSVATGIVEGITAILLLVKRTRVAGYCLAAGILTNILFINIGFDISVKTFTAFLLAVVLFNLYPYAKSMYTFFIRQKPAQLAVVQPPVNRRRKWINLLVGAGLFCYISVPYLLSGNFNDDDAARPLLHGAWLVKRFIARGDTLAPDVFWCKRVFIHRNSYIIFQHQDDRMEDYFFDLDRAKKQLLLYNYNNEKTVVGYDYNEKTGELQLTFDNREHWTIQATALDWNALPVLQDKTHYTIDEIK